MKKISKNKQKFLANRAKKIARNKKVRMAKRKDIKTQKLQEKIDKKNNIYQN